ncbi:MAG: ribonuclease R [Rhodobacteraceae bacterium]|nr:ribonuclease R [Paracoccaceae bacterium]
MANRSPLPSKQDLLKFIRAQSGAVAKRDIAKAFNLKGADRVALKHMLRDLSEEGEIDRGRRRFSKQRAPEDLPPVTLLEALEPDADGDLAAKPANWDHEAEPPKIVLAPAGKHTPSLGPGDRFLGRLKKLDDDGPYAYEAKIVKKLGRNARRVIGLFREGEHGGRIMPVDKRQQDEFIVERVDRGGAQDGELVEVELINGHRYGLKKARIVDRLGDPTAPRAISLIAIHEQGLPVDFPDEAIAEAQDSKPLTKLGKRLDLRGTPLVTIDPADARDHDDAVYAEKDQDPANPGGWIVWVAIADVAHYVLPGSALDRAARERGNSAYFPDRVVPMLPDELSGDLCSLHEGVDRPCLAVRMVLAENGAKKSHSFHRAMMRSAASLTYEQAQAAWEGEADDQAGPLLDPVINPLYNAYHAARKAHERRNPLDLDMPERKVEIDAEGRVAAINFRERFDAHRLIEEFMILANVCAAETLEARRRPLLYRVHEDPNPERIESLREILASIGIPLAKGQTMTPRLLNQALDQAAETEHSELVNMSVLRAQTQAYYNAENYGHFGLALSRYAHFTSPIRRYADLIVHRALIRGLGFGPDGQTDAEAEGLQATADHISITERRAMTAERDTTDRYLAAYLADREGAEFEGRISGVQRFGLFVKLKDSGADGFVPIATIGDEYFHYDEAGARLVGDRSGVELRMGAGVNVRLVEAAPVTGGLIFELLDLNTSRRRSSGARGARAEAPKAGRRVSRIRVQKAKDKVKAARKERRARHGAKPGTTARGKPGKRR